MRAICEQARKLVFYSTVVDVEVRRRAARRLIAACLAPLSHVFFVSSGAEAIENAVKLAVIQTGRKKVIAMAGAFHGRTLLALNLTHSPAYRKTMPYALDAVHFVPFGDLSAAREAIGKDVAAVILEPIQSMAGIVAANGSYYDGLASLCREAGAFLIYDEVQTGIGRTGTMFFSGRYGVVPDVMCLAKAMASGIPLGAVVVRGEHAEKVEYGQFGATFGGGPLAADGSSGAPGSDLPRPLPRSRLPPRCSSQLRWAPGGSPRHPFRACNRAGGVCRPRPKVRPANRTRVRSRHRKRHVDWGCGGKDVGS